MELKTISEMEATARDIHRVNYRLLGDSYATEQEIEHILADPLSFYEMMVRDQVTLVTGCIIKSSKVYVAGHIDLQQAARNEAKRLILRVVEIQRERGT